MPVSSIFRQIVSIVVQVVPDTTSHLYTHNPLFVESPFSVSVPHRLSLVHEHVLLHIQDEHSSNGDRNVNSDPMVIYLSIHSTKFTRNISFTHPKVFGKRDTNHMNPSSF